MIQPSTVLVSFKGIVSSDNETPCLNVDTAHLLRNKMEQNACLIYTKHMYIAETC